MLSTVPASRMRARDPSVTFAPMSAMMPGWKTSAARAAARTEIASTGSAGILRQMSTSVMTGTRNSQGVIWNLPARTEVYRSICEASEPSWDRPRTVKIIRVITMDGTVVKNMYRMCVKRGTLLTEDAITVVSDSGEILSPK